MMLKLKLKSYSRFKRPPTYLLVIACIFVIGFLVTVKDWYLSYVYALRFVNIPYSTRINNSFIEDKLDHLRTRDFLRYECKNRRRVGGSERFIRNAPDQLFRIDGAWYVCLDDVGSSFVPNKCTVLSFGINHDYSFDKEMRYKYLCDVFSFDPNNEADLFRKIRKSNWEYEKSAMLPVDHKWNFYRYGLTGSLAHKDFYTMRIGDFLNLNDALKLIGLQHRPIDLLKFDIEGGEKEFFANLDMDYACKYIKQIAFETHLNMKFNDLVKLEQCFMLYHRDTRFFLAEYDLRHGYVSEFQQRTGRIKLSLDYFENEQQLAEFMFVNGELYFINTKLLNLMN